MAVSRTKMLGHFCRAPGGYKCRCCRSWDTTQWRKAVERREVASEIREALTDSPALLPALYTDLSDCRHGCNGSPSCGASCTFICHPAPDPAVPPRATERG